MARPTSRRLFASRSEGMTRFKVAPGRVSKGLNLDFPQPKRQSRRLKRTRCRSPLPCPLARSLFPPTLLSLLSLLFPLGRDLAHSERSRNLLVRQIRRTTDEQLSRPPSRAPIHPGRRPPPRSARCSSSGRRRHEPRLDHVVDDDRPTRTTALLGRTDASRRRRCPPDDDNDPLDGTDDAARLAAAA